MKEIKTDGREAEQSEIIRDFKGQDILSARQFDQKSIDALFEKVDEMKAILEEREENPHILAGKNLGLLFFIPSVQTKITLQIAMNALGGNTVEVSSQELNGGKAVDRHTFEDNILIHANNYVDAIAVRPPEVGMLQIAANVSRVPIINAGEGKNGENPGQALSVLHTISDYEETLDGTTITFYGALKDDHTITSLTLLLSNYENIKINLVPLLPRFQLDEDLISELKSRGVNINEVSSLEELSQDYGILYLNRPSTEEQIIKKLGSAVGANILHLGNTLKIPPEAYSQARFVLSPAPRLEEIKESPYAVNYVQVRSGVPVRMALLSLIIKGS